MLNEGIGVLLAATAAVNQIVGTANSRRDKTNGIFYGQAPEGSDAPFVVISQIAGETLMSLDGPDALRFVRLQFTCYGEDFADAKQLQRAVRQALESFTGALCEGTVVQNMESVLERDSFEEAPFLFSAPLDIAIAFLDLGS
ncbi:MAG: DUF3168 domain-containing protein [Candidatus Acidiferrales bacterium]